MKGKLQQQQQQKKKKSISYVSPYVLQAANKANERAKNVSISIFLSIRLSYNDYYRLKLK